MPVLSDPEEDQTTGQPEGATRETAADQRGARPLSPSETSRFDQISAGLQAAGKFAGKNKKKLLWGSGIGLGVLGPILIFFFLLSLFKLNHIEKLYIDYQFTKVHRAMRERAKMMLDDAKETAKGTAQTTVNEDAPLREQLTELNAEKVNEATSSQPAADEITSRLYEADLSSGSTGGAIDQEFGVDRSIQEIDDKNKTQSEMDKAVQESDREAVQKGVPEPTGPLADTERAIQDEINNGTSPEEAATKPNVLASVKAFGLASKLSLFVTTSTFYCIGRDIYGAAAEKFSQIRSQELVRLAARTYTAADAQKAGKLSLGQVGAYNREFDNGNESFTDSASYHQATDQPVTDANPQITSAALPFVSQSSTLFNVINGIMTFPGTGLFCSAILNPVGQISAAVIENGLLAVGAIFSEGQDFTVTTAIRETVQQTVKSIFSKQFAKQGAKYLVASEGMKLVATMVAANEAGATTTGTEQPIQRANKVSAGTHIMAAESARLLGGRLLSAQEATDIQLNELQQEAPKSLIARLTDTGNPFSVGSQFLAALPSTPAGIMNSFSGFISSILSPSTIGRNILARLSASPTAMAADTNSDGIPDYGFTDAELKAYDPVQNAGYIESHPQIAEQYKHCFEGTLVDTYYNPDSYSDCNNPNNTDLLRYRLYRLDKATVKNFALTYNANSDSSSTTSVAGSYFNKADLYKDSSSIACAPGTNDLGVNTGYAQGQPVNIRLCALPNLPSTSEESTPGSAYYINGSNGDAIVNSVVSGAWLALVNAAKSAGLKVGATSSFRTMAHQQSLCPCDGVSIARPGYSNHQMGLAIDFQMSLSNSTSSCVMVDGRCEDPGDPLWQWLDKNAGQFQIKPYVNEFWHWSPTGN